MAKTIRTKAPYTGRERRRGKRRDKIDVDAVPEKGTRRRGAGRRDSDNFWAPVRRRRAGR